MGGLVAVLSFDPCPTLANYSLRFPSRIQTYHSHSAATITVLWRQARRYDQTSASEPEASHLLRLLPRYAQPDIGHGGWLLPSESTAFVFSWAHDC